MNNDKEGIDIFVHPLHPNRRAQIHWVMEGPKKSMGEAESSAVLLEFPLNRFSRMWIKDYSSYDSARDVDIREEVEKRYIDLKNRGFPVVDTLRVSEDGKKVLMTDVTQDGKCEVVDFHHQFDSTVRISNFSEMEEQAMRLYEKATRESITLGHPAAVIDIRSGIGKIMVLDLAEVGDFAPGDEKYWDNSLQNLNNNWRDRFINILKPLSINFG